MRIGAFVLSFALLSGSAAAFAQEPSGEALAASLKKFDEGRIAFEQKRYDDARRAFEASHRLQASPNSLLYIGRCFRETGKVASAYVALKRSEREARDRLTATLEKRYGATRDAAAEEAAQLEPRVPRLTVAVPGGLPSDFSVKVNGRELPRESWGLAIETDPGRIRIEANGTRLHPFVEEFLLEEGRTRRVDVRVDRLPTSTLMIALSRLPQGVTIQLDDVSLDPGDASDWRDVDPGAHRVVVAAPGYKTTTWTASLVDGQRARVPIELVPSVPSRGTPPWLFFAVGGGALVTAAVGTGFAIDASSMEKTELAKHPYARDPVVRDSIQTEATIANVLFASAVVLGVSATVLAFTTGWRRNDRAFFGPYTVGSGGGFLVGGTL